MQNASSKRLLVRCGPEALVSGDHCWMSYRLANMHATMYGLCYKMVFSQTRRRKRVVIVVVSPITSNMFDWLDATRLNG